MTSTDREQSLAFDCETLESLLNIQEGPTIDFKREQYHFNKATKDDKSELLKDVLAFANAQRYRAAYILIGVEEVKGGPREVVGIKNHLEDASLHQFVNSKTNRQVEFSYFPYQAGEKQIGVLSIPIQSRPIYTVSKYGKVEANTVYIRDGSSTRSASPDEIADMGRNNPPVLVEWSIERLRNTARHAIEITAEQWQRHPARHRECGSNPEQINYAKARKWVLTIAGNRYATLGGYSTEMDSYGSLHWVFRKFEELAAYCTQTIRTIGPALIESGSLMRAIVELESCIHSEKYVWDEFRIRAEDPNAPLPGEANYNLLSLAVRTVRFIDVLEDEDHYRDPDHDALNQYNQPVFWRSAKWGEWRL